MSADLVDILNTKLSSFFPEDSVFILAISGGVDSMVLLDVASSIVRFKFIVVSVDHSIRPDSREDIQLVKSQAKHYGFAFFSKRLAVPSLAKQARKGLEEAARDLRYQVLQKYRKQFSAAAIITAHHQNDQVETVLFHLVRGSDVHGLCGMEVLNKQGVFRPFLDVPKADLVHYAKEHLLLWHDDSTNVDLSLSRNFIRHMLVENFPIELLTEVSKKAQNLIDVCDDFIDQWCREYIKDDTFSRQAFLLLPLYLQFYFLQYLTRNFFHLRDLSFSWLTSLYQWIIHSHSSSSYSHRGKILLHNDHNYFKIVGKLK